MGAVFIYLPVGITAVIGFACGVGYVIRENRRKKRRRARVTLLLLIWRSSRVSPCMKPVGS